MRRLVHMLVLVLAGEMIFGLPFHTARFFRPTLLDAFGFSNTQLGDVFAVYGLTAMLAYFPGGALADPFQARKLMNLSLLATAAGGWLKVIYANVFVSFFAVFALRGVYFALLEETGTPRHLTGTTVAAVSLIGYSPEIFFGPVSGRILDRSPGLECHQDYFLFPAGCAVLDLLVTAGLVRAHGQQGRPAPSAR